MGTRVVRPYHGVYGITQVWGQIPGAPRGTVWPNGVDGHPGVDYGLPGGTPLYAVADGVVTWAGFADGFGLHCVSIWHPDLGVTSLVGHGQAHYVVQGQQVSCDQHIADSDNQGASTGNHLHFEIRPLNSAFGGNPPNIDPEAWLNLHLSGPLVIPTLSAGDRASIKRMQYLLGLSPANQTGFWGPVTDNSYQTLRWKLLCPPRKASVSSTVKAMQHDLFHFAAVDCDGIYGPKTDAAWQLCRLCWLGK